MAKIDFIDRGHEPDEYVVKRDDGSCYKCFRDYSEARAYYNYLQQLDDQQRSVQQNDEIIANQRRLIEIQERKSRIPPHRPSVPQVTKQVLDPEYEEWLRFKKATDPAFIAWKAEEERKKNEKLELEHKKQLEIEKENKRKEIEDLVNEISKYEIWEDNLETLTSKFNEFLTHAKFIFKSSPNKIIYIGSYIIFNNNLLDDFYYAPAKLIREDYASKLHVYCSEAESLKIKRKQLNINVADDNNYISQLKEILDKHKSIGRDYMFYCLMSDFQKSWLYFILLKHDININLEYQSYGLFSGKGNLRDQGKKFCQQHGFMFQYFNNNLAKLLEICQYIYRYGYINNVEFFSKYPNQIQLSNYWLSECQRYGINREYINLIQRYSK